MKLKNTLWITILTITGLMLGSFSAYASTYNGHLDSITGNNISGWAWNSAAPESAVTVRLTVTDQKSGQVMEEFTAEASTYRDDLAALGQGTGYYGFNASMNLDQLADGYYRVEAYIEDTKLANSLTFTKGISATENLVPLGIFKTTGYCPCYSCSEGWGRHTATGALATASHTIAVDPKVIPYGSKVMINGTVYTAEDKGGGVKGHHIDIYFNTHGETRQHGVRNLEVFLVNE